MRKFLERYCLKVRYISGYKRYICSELTKRQKIDRLYSYLTECAKIVDKPINRVYFTDDRGIVHEDGCDINNNHFHKGTYNDENWYRIVNSNMYESV